VCVHRHVHSGDGPMNLWEYSKITKIFA
jgi:hypothetical protein